MKATPNNYSIVFQKMSEAAVSDGDLFAEIKEIANEVEDVALLLDELKTLSVSQQGDSREEFFTGT